PRAHHAVGGGPQADAGAAQAGAHPRRRPLGAHVPRRAGPPAVRRGGAVTDLQAAVEALARVPRLLVALDFDGVLAPIVPVPSDARPLPESAAAIDELASLPDTTVALLSGRGRADLAAVSGFGDPVRLIGSHGSELDDGSSPLDDEQR